MQADCTALTPLDLAAVSVTREGRTILGPVDWRIEAGERWVVLGANGSGKSTMVQIAALQLHPSSGDVTVLGERLGRTDVRTLRRRVGYASATLGGMLRANLAARDVVMTAKYAALEPWWHTYDDVDRSAAEACLARLGVERFADRPWGTLSSGEQQRVLVARTLMGEIGLVLLDEPNAGLDVGGRENLLAGLNDLALDPATPAMVLVTHHVEEIPPAFTHALLLRAGQARAAGPIEATLTADALSDAFGLELTLERRPNGRYAAFAP
jgi:iron complex transport system ATP-binding protein